MIRPRVAIVADLREEGWPSMDLVADMLISGLGSATGPLSIRCSSAPRRRG